MRDQNAAFVGSIPENYDRYLGPVLFEPYARDLSERVKVAADASLLEIACGTGVLTRILRNSLPSTAKLVSTDLNEAMMQIAAKKFRPDELIEFKQADAAQLPFADNSFDTVVCQFGFMFVPDKKAALAEAHRVLVPDGSLVFSVWDRIEYNELAWIAHQTIAKFFASDPPLFYETPFSMHDTEEIVALLEAADFRELNIALLKLVSTASSSPEVARGLVRGNPVITAIEERALASVSEIERAVAAQVASRCGDNPVKAQMQAFVCECVA